MGVGFITAVFQNLLASAIYSAGGEFWAAFSKRIAFSKRYKKAFERAVCRFYADPKYSGNEGRRNFSEYQKLLLDASLEEDIVNSNSQVYSEMFDLFSQEIAKDKLLNGYTILKGVFTTQKKLGELAGQTKELIELARANRNESKLEHNDILKQIKGLKELIINPALQDLKMAPLDGSSVLQNDQETHIVKREQLTNKCVDALVNHKVLILHGALKVGKTTLAQLIKSKMDDVNIIDDVAEKDVESILADLLSSKRVGKYVITTSTPLNKNISILDFSNLDQEEVPLLNFAETVELIESYSPTCNLSTFIYGHTNGHPVLVKTLCSYFVSCGWRLDVENFRQILCYSFDNNLLRFLADLMGRIITEVKTRDLLNRLILVNGSFTEVNACQLAEIAPQIEEPRRRLFSLMPTWISETDGCYKVTPLLKKVWNSDASSDCKKQCNKLLAQSILNLSCPLSELDILNYINYSVSAEEYDDAGHMYITILHKIHEENKSLSEKSVLRGLWLSHPLPAEMSLYVRIGVRIAQLMFLGGLAKKHRHYLLWDLKQLVDSYEEDDFKAFFYGTVTLLCWQEDEISEGLRYYSIYSALDHKEMVAVMSQIGEKISLFNNNIWIFLLRLTKMEEYETWLDTFHTSHPVYSHDDQNVCESCYLSVSRLITHHLIDCDFGGKMNALKRILNKAEQCECPEVAVVCLFKMIDLYAIETKFEDAKVLYESQYEKYKCYPLAEILFNGAMAYACYKSGHTAVDDWVYFKKVMEFSNKELIPDIQLHITEVFAYVVSEKDQKKGIDILTGALDYASDEKHRIDIFDYYQCKGELTYAYWSAGEKVKAAGLLSDCIEFVLPLAETEKRFAKSYLCLCNCLLTKCCLDVQNKPLPENQASPVKGMFTENDLIKFDDLYTIERQYVTCYQMSDLCDNLLMKELAYEWAKKAVEASKKRGEVQETHHLLFLLTPLFNEERDLETIEYIIKHSDEARRLTMQKHPEMKKSSSDLEFVEFQIVPLLMKALVMKVRGKDNGMNLVKSIVKSYIAVADEETIRFVKKVFERETFDRSFVTEVNKLNMQDHYCVYLCAYILTAFYSDSEYAFDLLMAVLPDLQKQLVQIYGKRILSTINLFVSTFWKIRILRNSEEFNNYDRLKDRGIKLIDDYEGKVNQANKTMMIISNHLRLRHTLNKNQMDWLDA